MRTASPHAMTIVKSTAPALEKHGVEITTAMYARLFRNPAIEALFDNAAQSSGEQPRPLAGANLPYARNIDKLATLPHPAYPLLPRHPAPRVPADHDPSS